MSEKATNSVSDIFDQGLKNFEQALLAGVKLQEEAFKNWNRMFNLAGSPQDFQKQAAMFDNDIISASRKSMDECLELLEQNTHATVDLMRKGLEAAQIGTYPETHARAAEFCERTLKTLKTNAQTIVDIQNKAIDAWLSFAKKATAPMSEAKGQKA